MFRFPRRAVWLPLSIFFTVIWYFLRSPDPIGFDQQVSNCPTDTTDNDPITAQIRNAHRAYQQQEALFTQASDLAGAARRYRSLRGRHPFPGFEHWHKYATRHNAIMPEEFFDQIYKDFEPFWGIEPAAIRASVALWGEKLLTIKDGMLIDRDDDNFRTFVVAEMVKMLAPMLPDLDIASNYQDEPRVFAPFELVNKTMHAAAEQKARMATIPIDRVFQGLKQKPTGVDSTPDVAHKPTWYTEREDMLDATRHGCPPGTPLRNGERLLAKLESAMSNMTAARDVCTHPEFLKSHGFFLGADSIMVSKQLVPVFSTSKLNVNNDILIPDPSYWAEGDLYEATTYWGDDASLAYKWKNKRHGLIWRGGATGGTNCELMINSHRHRFVRTLNASHIMYKDQTEAELAEWVYRSADAKFTTLFCPEDGEDFEKAPPMAMSKEYKWKYLPDVDGNTMSGRFRALMRSNSAVMKQTMFAEWHDSRLMAWKHYIPVDTAFSGLYHTMDYFLGRAGLKNAPGKCAHDQQGHDIAVEGSKWSEKVLRKDDMQVYLLRVLLEYARIIDDDRDYLGYVQDLLEADR